MSATSKNKWAIDDGTWFDRDSAQEWDETTRFDGNNFLSNATGSQWDHQTLYRTAKGSWVIHETSQWQDRPNRTYRISDDDAQAWLARCGYDEDLADDREV